MQQHGQQQLHNALHEQHNKLGHKQNKQQIHSRPPIMIAIKAPIIIGKLKKENGLSEIMWLKNLTFLSTIVANILMCH